MKKVILGIVFVFATGITFINANQSDEKLKTIEEYGCVSECLSASREGALWEVGEDGDRSAGGELVQAFERYYEACLATEC